MDGRDDHAPASARRRPRVLVVLLALVLVTGIAAALVPGVRRQLDLSFTRQPASFLELYFAEAADGGGQVTCSSGTDGVRVSFVVEGHGGERRTVPYRVLVEPRGRQGRAAQDKAGTVRVGPGDAQPVQVRFRPARPRGYDVRVVLPEDEQEIRATCRGRG